MGFNKAGLTSWREAVDGTEGAKLAEIIADLTAQGARIDAPELKRVPAPYDKDHPNGELLKRKSLTLWFDLSEADLSDKGLRQATQEAFKKIAPLQRALRDTL